MRKRLLLIVALATAVTIRAVPEKSSIYKVKEFSYYQTIIDRAPFGVMAKDESLDGDKKAPEGPTISETVAALAQQIKMSGITVMPDGVLAIGFSDTSVNPPVFHFLRVGESHHSGWHALAASYRDEWATLEKDGVEVTIQLGKGVIPGPPTAEELAAKRQAALEANNPKAPAILGLIAPTIGKNATVTTRSVPKKPGEPLSYAERLRQRAKEQEEAKRVAAMALQEQLEAKKAAEEEERDRKVDLELIKRGLPPTKPIKLTPEEDRALSAAGAFTPGANAQPVEAPAVLTPQD